MIAGIFPLLFGQGQLCRWSNISDVIRSFLWHVLILQVSILSVVHAEIGKNIKNDYKYFLGAVTIFVGLTVIAQLINVTLITPEASTTNRQTENRSKMSRTLRYSIQISLPVSTFLPSSFPICLSILKYG